MISMNDDLLKRLDEQLVKQGQMSKTAPFEDRPLPEPVAPPEMPMGMLPMMPAEQMAPTQKRHPAMMGAGWGKQKKAGGFLPRSLVEKMKEGMRG
jgi:hypothetical protein